MITHGSTFSGIGAPEIAAEMLGWTNSFHCEINPFGRKILNHYFPNAESYEDITKTDFSKWRGKIIVLTGGFPCQPFSYAGKRRGSEDDRYLWPFMLRCIEQVRPTWFVGENVAGITTMAFPSEDVKVGEQTDLFGACNEVYEKHERYVLNEICESLERAGYSVQPMLIPACAVGAPHRRDRIFIIAYSKSEQGGCCIERLSCESTQEQFGGRSGKDDMGQKTSTDTDCNRGREVHEHLQPEQSDGAIFERISWERFASDTDRFMLGARNNSRIEEWQAENRIESHDSEGASYRIGGAWSQFPSTKPAVRGRDDGFPFDVDSLAIPLTEWRAQALKAYGNAIVPQVMYEIFRGIDIIENQKK